MSEQQEIHQDFKAQDFSHDHEQVGLQLDTNVQEQFIQEEEAPCAIFTPIQFLKEHNWTEKEIEKLIGLGVHSIEQSQHLPDRALLAAGITEGKLAKLRQINSESVQFVSAKDLLAARNKMALITTRCTSLDSLLGGGLEPGTITEIYGEFNTGKTQFCHTVAVASQLPRAFGGAEGRVLYIDTEGTFRPERIVEIALSMGLAEEEILDNIQVARALNSDHLRDLSKKCAELMSRDRFSLLICDSATSLFRTDYQGRGALSERQTSLAKFLRDLHGLAHTYNVAVVITNQVVSDIAGAAQMGGGLDSKKPIGGNIIAHASTSRLHFRKGRNGCKIARLVDSPLVAEGEATFKITAAGITEIGEDDI